MRTIPVLSALCLSLGLAGGAEAHVSVTPAAAQPGAIVEASFKVGHGCGDAATTAVSITAGGPAKLVHPMDAKGWTMAGVRKNNKVVGATWTAGAGAAMPEGFLMHVELPAQKGPLYFDVTQTCGAVQVQWTERPAADGKKLEHPAPMIDVGGKAPAPSSGDHHH